MNAAQPAAIRRKVEAWLAEDDATPALALRAKAEWDGDTVLPIADATVRIVPCATPLAARAALHDRADAERLVLLTELTDAELGDGLLAHLSRQRVRNVDIWDVTAHLFGLAKVDSTLARLGRWAAEALIDHAPAGGWPPPAGTIVTRDHALRCLAAELLGVDREQIDSAGLLQWTTDAARVLRLTKLPSAVTTGLTSFLIDVAGPAATAIMAAARAGHGVDAVPLGLLAGVLWPAPSGGRKATEVAVARTRLEPFFGGSRLSDREAGAFSAAAEAWVDRVVASGDESDQAEAYRMVARAESIAKEIDATTLLGASDLLPSGFLHRLREVAVAVRLAVPAAGSVNPAQLGAAQTALARLDEHRGGDRSRVETAHMAVRLLRWLSAADPCPPATLQEALLRQVRADAWVDRARLDVFAGDPDPQVAEAFHLLHRAVNARRARHDQHFAQLLADATQAESEPGSLIRVEDLLERVVRPILDHGRRVLLLVMDGMSTAAATELAESITRAGPWTELTPGGGARVGVLAALPTITDVSRCSLLSGRIAVGGQAAEIKAFGQLFPASRLLHKGGLRSYAGSAIAPDVVDALADAATPLVAAVVNTIDDALDRSEPGTTVWGKETIRAVADLFAVAGERVVVIVSDHGHVIDRGLEAEHRPSSSSENRWRPADGPPDEGEVLVRGSRVATAAGAVVLPWKEEIRYGPRKAGYHGGASPAEAVIPLLIFSDGDEAAVPGWSAAPVASPDWWRETVAAPAAAPPAKRIPVRKQEKQAESLFDVISPSRAPTYAPAAARPDLVDALLGSEVYRQRRSTRAPLPDDRVAALITVLLTSGNRASLDTLAARAGVPAGRITLTVTALRKLLQVEGYPVLSIDPDGTTVKLDVELLIEQFHLDAR